MLRQKYIIKTRHCAFIFPPASPVGKTCWTDIKMMLTVTHQPSTLGQKRKFLWCQLSTSNWHQLLASNWCHTMTLKKSFQPTFFFNQNVLSPYLLPVIIFKTHSWHIDFMCWCPYDTCNLASAWCQNYVYCILMLCHDIDQTFKSISGLSENWVSSIVPICKN